MLVGERVIIGLIANLGMRENKVCDIDVHPYKDGENSDG